MIVSFRVRERLPQRVCIIFLPGDVARTLPTCCQNYCRYSDVLNLFLPAVVRLAIASRCKRQVMTQESSGTAYVPGPATSGAILWSELVFSQENSRLQQQIIEPSFRSRSLHLQ